jgi:metallo-beta-lactamase family protein
MTKPAITFLGGTGTVTGSRFLVDAAGARVLVDCGLYQGTKELRWRNWATFPVPPSTIDAVVLTHAHVDHCGALPRLLNDGFRGSVWSTAGTAALAGIVLPDAGHLQEEEAAYANRKGYSKHHPALPLYTEDDGRAAADLVQPVDLTAPCEVAPGVVLTLRPAGHILGSATAELLVDGATTIQFSGDLGRPRHPLLVAPDPPVAADALVMESTYGNRSHDDANVLDRLADVVHRTAARGGTIVIPAFAVDRTEIILVHLAELMSDGRIPRLPVFVDSPMALASLAVYRRAVRERWPEVKPELFDNDDPFETGTLEEVRDVERSKEIDQLRYPSIVVSASGMATGGRVLHHLAARLPDQRNSVLLVGFQAEGTRGRLLVEGPRLVKMFGEYVAVRAEVVELPALSVHADSSELVDWVAAARRPPDIVYAVHGEPAASAALCASLGDRLDQAAVAPTYLERVVVGHR